MSNIEINQASEGTQVLSQLITDFNLNSAVAPNQTPFEIITTLREKGRALFNPCDHRGRASWILTRNEDIRLLLQDTETFSSKGNAGFSAMVGESWDMIPLEIDPPSHTRFRILLNPLFTPKRIDALSAGVRETAVGLIDRFAQGKGCEFMEAFGFPFPVTIFLQLMGLPVERRLEFSHWADRLLRGAIPEKVEAAKSILVYLRGLITEKKNKPEDDLASFVAMAGIDGNPLSDDEIIGIYYLMFIGGLDTVASSLGFIFNYLATHPEDQAFLREHPEKHEDAIEEMLRAFSVVTSQRVVTKDVEFAGVQMRKGQYVTVNYALANLDPAAYPEPLQVKIHREPSRHVAFAFGAHRCLGAPLARRELKIAFEEWFSRVPPFRLKPGSEPTMHAGGVFGVDKLELAWD